MLECVNTCMGFFIARYGSSLQKSEGMPEVARRPPTQILRVSYERHHSLFKCYSSGHGSTGEQAMKLQSICSHATSTHSQTQTYKHIYTCAHLDTETNTQTRTKTDLQTHPHTQLPMCQTKQHTCTWAPQVNHCDLVSLGPPT